MLATQNPSITWSSRDPAPSNVSPSMPTCDHSRTSQPWSTRSPSRLYRSETEKDWRQDGCLKVSRISRGAHLGSSHMLTGLLIWIRYACYRSLIQECRCSNGNSIWEKWKRKSELSFKIISIINIDCSQFQSYSCCCLISLVVGYCCCKRVVC